jgi:methionyl-tRNA formyltransferase
MGLRIAIFGQAPFGRDVAARLAEAGHEVVGVHVPPDQGSRKDPLAELAEEEGWRLVRHKAFRRKGEARPELVEEYLSFGAELNVMPFTTVILPPEIVDAPRLGSLCFHPSILPAYRGGNALAWQIILGAEESGVTVFKPDEGVDTGPIVLQKRGVPIEPTDNTASLYFDRLYPLGVDAMAEAVAAVADGSATFTAQSEEGASFQGLVDDAAARIDWSRSGEELDRLIRGCDPQPGALAMWGGEEIRLHGGRLESGDHAEAPGSVLGLAEDGRLRVAAAGGRVLSIAKLKVGDGKKAAAAEAGLSQGDRLE